MFSIRLQILLVCASEQLWQEVSASLRDSPVELRWLRSIDSLSRRLRPDAVILETTSLEDIYRLRNLLPDPPILLLSEHADYQWGLAALREGASDFLTTGECGDGALFRLVRFSFERAKVSRALERGQHQLVAAQRMEAIGRSVAGVAHDFRHFLQVVYGNCSLMKRMSGSPALDEMIDEMKTAGDKMNNLIKQMLEFAEGSPARSALLDLNHALESLSSLTKNLRRPGVALQTDLCREPLLVHLDSRIEQVIMNLVINAADAIGPEGGRILIETRALDLDRDFLDLRICLPEGTYAVLEVSDTGEGILPQDLDRIFEPFFTTKSRDIGTGLGLSTVFTLMQEWNGHVIVASVPGAGTTFKLIFPRKGRPCSAPAATKPTIPAVELSEPNEARQLLLRRDLTALGYEVSSVDRSSSTLRVGDREHPELVVCDLSPALLQSLPTSVSIGAELLATPFSRAELGKSLLRLQDKVGVQPDPESHEGETVDQ